MDRSSRSEIFLVLFLHGERGPLAGWLLVSPKPAGWWQTEWDIGTIDRDPQLSDQWFCRDQYEQKFLQVLQRAAAEPDSVDFDIPCATSRWGMAKGLRRENALDLANQVLALWEEILVDWQTGGSQHC
jgi:hypothetical protein